MCTNKVRIPHPPPPARDEECRAVEVGAENSPCFQGPFRCFITFQMTFSMPAADDPGTGILARSFAVLQCKSAVFVVCPALRPLLLLLQQLCRKLIPSPRFFSLLSSPTF
jgi:hypothetical protein